MNYNVCGIYSITNPIGEKYIGSSRCIRKRWIRHKFKSQNHRKLFTSLEKYGIENHLFEIITECHPSLLIDYEVFYQKKFDTVKNGLNCNYANESPRKGKTHNEEAKQKNRLAHLGKKLSEETKNKISSSLIGISKKPMSEETKRKVSEAKKGVKLNLSDEQREKRRLQVSQIIRTNGKKVKCTETGKIYDSIAKAAKDNNINEANLRYWLNYRPDYNKTSLIKI